MAKRNWLDVNAKGFVTPELDEDHLAVKTSDVPKLRFKETPTEGVPY